jgi:hypothetical protein
MMYSRAIGRVDAEEKISGVSESLSPSLTDVISDTNWSVRYV